MSPARASAEAARAQALLEGRPTSALRADGEKASAAEKLVAVEKPAAAEKPAAVEKAAAASAAGGSRFIVQVGAYAGEQSVQEARAKLEKLGLRTYTQVTETASGKRTRVRVGPFASREEAERGGGENQVGGAAGGDHRAVTRPAGRR